MKKWMILMLAVVMVFSAVSALAEEEGQIAPLYATVGEAMEASEDGRRVAGGIHGEYFAVVTEKDGKYYRNVANYDEKLIELNNVVENLDYEAEDFFEQHEAASNAVDEYLMTLPIAYSEEFTAQPLTQEEMDSRVGKSLSQLTEEGFEIGSNGTELDENEEMIIVFSLRYGVYDYSCVVDADFDTYYAAQENGTEGDLIVKSMKVAGITEWGFDRRFHTDGTVEEQADPFADMSEILVAFTQLAQNIQNGEEFDIDAFANTLKEQYPNTAELIDSYVTLFQSYGAETFAKLMTGEATPEEAPAETPAE